LYCEKSLDTSQLAAASPAPAAPNISPQCDDVTS
jgi:hypothetical protein